MIPQETVTLIRNLFYAEHWKIGTIASELGLHYDTVRRAVEADRFSSRVARSTLVDPYADFVRETLASYPRLRATRIFQMLQVRGYTGSVNTLRRAVADLRPSRREAFLRLRTFPGDQGQVDWAHFGKVKVGRAERKLSCFVSTLSYSRALYLEFFLIRGSRASYAAMCAPFRIGVASRETCSVTISVQLSWSVAVMRCIFTRACLNSVLIIISWFVLVRWGAATRRVAWNVPFSTSAVRFSLPGPSPHSRTSTARLCVGATKS